MTRSLSRRQVLVSGGALPLLVAPSLFAASALAQSPADLAAAPLLTRITEARTPVRTLAGPFHQTRTLGLLAAEVHSTGVMALVRPDRLRWTLLPPDDVTFWMGPEGLAYRSARSHGKAPETTARVAAALDDLRSLLGGDVRRLEAHWILRVLRDDAFGAEIDATRRDPTASSGGLRRIQFALAADLVRPTRATLVESEHDHTVIEFDHLVVNAPVDPATMRAD